MHSLGGGLRSPDAPFSLYVLPTCYSSLFYYFLLLSLSPSTLCTSLSLSFLSSTHSFPIVLPSSQLPFTYFSHPHHLPSINQTVTHFPSPQTVASETSGIRTAFHHHVPSTSTYPHTATSSTRSLAAADCEGRLEAGLEGLLAQEPSSHKALHLNLALQQTFRSTIAKVEEALKKNQLAQVCV